MLNRYGFNTVFGPVADIAYSESGYTSGDLFGSDPEEVRGMVRNAVHGELDQGLHVCVQYFPGYGDITSSPSGTRPVSSRTAEEIEKTNIRFIRMPLTAERNLLWFHRLRINLLP